MATPTTLLVLSLIALLFPMLGCSDTGYDRSNKLYAIKGENMNSLVLTHEVIIKDESGLVPEPHAMAKTADGGFIVAGSVGRAWAIKTDSKGQLVWRYLQDQPLSNGGYTTAFTGALAMSDGSTYLCGNTSLKGKGYTPAILTHLNSAGQLIKEQLFVPQSRTAAGLSYFDNCVRWGER